MSGAVTKLATLTPSGTTAAAFSGISSSYDDIYIVASVKTDSTSSSLTRATARLYYQFNSDTSFNYNSVNVYVQGHSSVTTGEDYWNGGTASNNMYLSCAPTSYYSSSNGWGSFEMYIPGYAVATSSNPDYLGKPHRVLGCYDFASSGTAYMGNSFNQMNYGMATGTNTAITSINFKTIYGNYKAGTTMTMYGIKNT